MSLQDHVYSVCMKLYQDEISIIEMVVQYMCMYVVCSLSFTQIQAPYKEFQRLQENILDFT